MCIYRSIYIYIYIYLNEYMCVCVCAFLWCRVHKGMAWSCVGGFRLGISKRFFSQRMAGTGSPGWWSRHQAGRVEDLDNVLQHMVCDSWDVLCKARSWTWWSLQIFSHSRDSVVLWYACMSIFKVSGLDFYINLCKNFYKSEAYLALETAISSKACRLCVVWSTNSWVT